MRIDDSRPEPLLGSEVEAVVVHENVEDRVSLHPKLIRLLRQLIRIQDELGFGIRLQEASKCPSGSDLVLRGPDSVRVEH